MTLHTNKFLKQGTFPQTGFSGLFEPKILAGPSGSIHVKPTELIACRVELLHGGIHVFRQEGRLWSRKLHVSSWAYVFTKFLQSTQNFDRLGCLGSLR